MIIKLSVSFFCGQIQLWFPTPRWSTQKELELKRCHFIVFLVVFSPGRLLDGHSYLSHVGWGRKCSTGTFQQKQPFKPHRWWSRGEEGWGMAGVLLILPVCGHRLYTFVLTVSFSEPLVLPVKPRYDSPLTNSIPTLWKQNIHENCFELQPKSQIPFLFLSYTGYYFF